MGKFRILATVICISFFTSCNKHLDEKIFKSGDITVKWYRISTITTVHDYVDLERWNYSDNIINANTDGIYDIKIVGDTIIIKTLPSLMIYDLVALKNGCHIKVDSTVSKYEYMKRFQPKNAKYYINE